MDAKAHSPPLVTINIYILNKILKTISDMSDKHFDGTEVTFRRLNTIIKRSEIIKLGGK